MKTILYSVPGILYCCALSAQTIKTPTNVTVNVNNYSEMSPASIAYVDSVAAKWISDHGSGAVKVASPSATYNCHAYAWHIKDGGSTVWINAHDDVDDDPEELSPYWSGGSPTYVSAPASEATAAFYGSCWVPASPYYINNCDHSAKVISTSLFESKWGNWPRYQHAPGDCPYTSSGIQYYKVAVSGADLLCSSPSQSYSTLNISGASYSWSGSNTSVSGSSYSVSATATGSATTGSVQVNISSPYSGTTVTGKKTVWVGSPAVTGITVNTSMCAGYGQVVTAATAGNPTYFNWYVSSGNASNAYLSNYGNGSASFNSYIPDCYGLTLNFSNSCGSSNDGTTICVDYCFARYSVYPNPTRDYVNIHFDRFDKADLLPTQLLLYSEATQQTVYSANNDRLFGSLTREGVLQIPVKSMPRGTYYLHVFTGKNEGQKPEVTRIILE